MDQGKGGGQGRACPLLLKAEGRSYMAQDDMRMALTRSMQNTRTSLAIFFMAEFPSLACYVS